MEKPKNKTEFARIVKTAKPSELKTIGFRYWDDRKKIMLIPKELYDMIPEGFPVVGLGGQKEKFGRKTHDNDCRFGVLAYGISVNGTKRKLHLKKAKPVRK